MNLFETIKSLITDAVLACKELFKVMIPVIIAVKVLQELGVIQYLALPLKPLMGLVGLPAEMGLAWATAIFNTTYAGLVVILSLAETVPMSTAQATVLAVMILVCHSLPVESSIARKSGPKFLFQCLIRIAAALVLGWLLNLIYTTTSTLQGPAVMLLQPSPEASPGLIPWALDQLMNLGSIFVIVLGLMTLMRVLTFLRIIEFMNRLLRPVLRLVGIGPKASAITVIGLTLGLSYGGGLIIREAQTGNVGKRDVFYSLTLMGICHSLIEDTMLLMLVGGHISGVLWGRLLFSLLVMAVLVPVVKRLPAAFSDKYLWGDPPGVPAKTTP